MKQIVIYNNPLVKELSGSQVELYPFTPEGESITMVGGKVNSVRIPFHIKVLSGGKMDLDFKLSKELAQNGVTLLGAYWDGQEVKAYFMPLEGLDVSINSDVPVLIGTLVQLVTYRQVDGNIMGGVVDLNQSGDGLAVEMKPEESKNTKSKPKKKK